MREAAKNIKLRLTDATTMQVFCERACRDIEDFQAAADESDKYFTMDDFKSKEFAPTPNKDSTAIYEFELECMGRKWKYFYIMQDLEIH